MKLYSFQQLFRQKISSRLRPFLRKYAVQAPGGPRLQIFNTNAKILQKERAANHAEESRKVEYLRNEVAQRLCERLLDIQRQFPSVLDLGANSLNIARSLTQPDQVTAASPSPLRTNSSEITKPDTSNLFTGRVGHLTCVEPASTLLNRDPEPESPFPIDTQHVESLESIPFEPNSFDAVLSSLSLHWVNDLPSTLAQINTVLKPDSPFVAAMLGGDSIYELRTSLQLADMERRGGVSTRISPMADVRDVGGLLSRAGFKLLTVDIDDIVVDFPDTFALMTDLQAMGESNAILRGLGNLGALTKDVLLANEGIYKRLHGEEDKDSIPATFRVIYMIGWKEGAGQVSPLSRGSGDLNLKDVFGGGDFKPG